MGYMIPSVEEYIEAINERICTAESTNKLHLVNRLKNHLNEFINASLKIDEYHRKRTDKINKH